MVWCGSKNGYQEDMYVEEFRPHDKNMITILDSTVRIIWRDLHRHLMKHENLHLDNELQKLY
jgi:hypothetical protein